MKRKSKQKSGKQIDQTKLIALAVIIITVIAIFVIIENPQTLSLGTIVDLDYYGTNVAIKPEYRTPVGGQITIPFAMGTFDGKDGVAADLEKYQYNYDIWNDDLNLIVARAPSWRLIHIWQNSITLQMNKEGTFNYSMRETIEYLQEGNRKVNGTVKRFKVIVGNGMNPNPTPAPSVGTGGTATVAYDPTNEVTVITPPEPAVTFVPYDPGVSPTLTPIKVIPTPTPARTGTPVVTTQALPVPVVTEDKDLTFVPAADITETPAKETAGFEIILAFISILILIRMRK